jgi:hypothetical protein
MPDRIEGITERMEALEEKVNRVIDAAIEKDEESLREGPVEQVTIMDIDKRVKAIAPTMDAAKIAIAEEVKRVIGEEDFITKMAVRDIVTREVNLAMPNQATIIAPKAKPTKVVKKVKKAPKL